MSKRITGRTDEGLGAKLAELELAVGYLHDRDAFANASLARRLGIDAASMRRKRIGQDNIDNSDVSGLMALFDLGGKLDPRVFELAPQAFRDALKAARIGIYAGRAGSEGLATLLKLSENEKRCAVSLTSRPKPVDRGSGLGIVDARLDNAPILRLGDRVIIEVKIHAKDPASGFLALLTDCLGNETFCLSPSSLIPMERIGQGNLRLPSMDTPDAARFGASGPIGHHRLYAIWSTTDLPFEILDMAARSKRAPDKVSGIDVDRLAQAIKDRTQTDRAVATFDYRVEG